LLNYVKNNYRQLIVAFCYILIATIVYTVLASSIWNLWYVTLLCGVFVFIIGVVIAYFYIRFLNKEANIKKENELNKEDSK